jgi:hypothetical protein
MRPLLNALSIVLKVLGRTKFFGGFVGGLGANQTGRPNNSRDYETNKGYQDALVYRL